MGMYELVLFMIGFFCGGGLVIALTMLEKIERRNIEAIVDAKLKEGKRK